MNEELKKKIKYIQDNEWATNEKILEDLVKQGYKKEDIQEILYKNTLKKEMVVEAKNNTKFDLVVHWLVAGLLFLQSFAFLLLIILSPTPSSISVGIGLIGASCLVAFIVLDNKILGYILALLLSIILGAISVIFIGMSGWGSGHDRLTVLFLNFLAYIYLPALLIISVLSVFVIIGRIIRKLKSK